MKIKWYLPLLLILLCITSCEKDNDIDTEKPLIDNSFPGAFPVNCDTLYFGESFELKVLFTDNAELGSYSINIHNNFDHHSHSTEVMDCNLDPIKEPVNPFTFIDGYAIPDGLKTYETSLDFSVPSGNSDGIFDEGDYHIMVSLTDKEGWSSQLGLSIKMLHP